MEKYIWGCYLIAIYAIERLLFQDTEKDTLKGVPKNSSFEKLKIKNALIFDIYCQAQTQPNRSSAEGLS